MRADRENPGDSGRGSGSDPEGEDRPFQKRFLRKAVEIRVEVERYQEGLSSVSINMSPSGVCFELDEPLDPGEQFKILLYIPYGKEVEILKVTARMVWQELRDDGRFRVGAAFEKFAPGDERRIRQWLLDVEKNPPPPPTTPGR